MVRISLVVVVLAAVLALTRIAGSDLHAQQPMLQIGQTYLVVFSGACTAGVGCYGEVHKVQAIGKDGWLDTQQCENKTCSESSAWRVNLSQVMAIQPFRVGKAAN